MTYREIPKIFNILSIQSLWIGYTELLAQAETNIA